MYALLRLCSALPFGLEEGKVCPIRLPLSVLECPNLNLKPGNNKLVAEEPQ